MRILSFAVLLFVVQVLLHSTAVVFAQNDSSATWITGKGSAAGTDIDAMRTHAINHARAEALKQAGVVIRADDIQMKTESGKLLVDFYSQFAETQMRGLIVEERNVNVSDPIRTSPPSENSNVQYRIDATLEALIVIPPGEPEAGFEVTMHSDRTSYREDEPIKLTVASTRDGYVSIFNVYNDSLSVIFPNALDSKNTIKANMNLTIPTNDSYSLMMEPPHGKQRSAEEFIAVVTKENIPFHNIDEVSIAGDRLKMKESLLTVFAKWLYKIPLNERCSDSIVLEVAKK